MLVDLASFFIIVSCSEDVVVLHSNYLIGTIFFMGINSFNNYNDKSINDHKAII